MKFLFLTLLLISSNVKASDWINLYIVPQTGATLKIDKESILRKNQSITYWQKLEYPNVQKLGNIYYSYTTSNQTMNCSTREIVMSSFYSFNGSQLTDVATPSNFPQLNRSESIMPDSIGEKIFNYLCK